MIFKSVVMRCSAERAFSVFTEQASSWWPADRRHTSDPESRIFMLATGRFYERASDGREVELGLVRTWEPERRVVLDFFVGTDAAHPTEVVVTFTPEGEGTRVSIEHRPKPESQELWSGRAPRYEASWDRVLAAFEGAV
jgi:hypothetical protein